MSTQELLRTPEVAEGEIELTVLDSSGATLLRAAVDGDKPTGELAKELAALALDSQDGSALYHDGQRLDPSRTISQNLQTGEATVTLRQDLTGN
ncbi:MAG: hypothetical protein U9R79_03210 [Armatimonadota bacterium]|nr:hypothetical protein [Armatimonadota bacterium]